MKKKIKFLLMCLLCAASTSVFAEDVVYSAGYRQVEWIQPTDFNYMHWDVNGSKGVSTYINTDYVPNNNTLVQINFTNFAYKKSGYINETYPVMFGCANCVKDGDKIKVSNWKNGSTLIYEPATTKVFFSFIEFSGNNPTAINLKGTLDDGNPKTKSSSVDANAFIANRYGYRYRSMSEAKTFKSLGGKEEVLIEGMNSPIGIFGRILTTDGTLADQFSQFRLYKFIICEGNYTGVPAWDVNEAGSGAYGTVKRNFVPVYNNATGEYGLWDQVEKKFYGNAGEGSFTGGEKTFAAYTRDVTSTTATGGFKYGTICLDKNVPVSTPDFIEDGAQPAIEFYSINGKQLNGDGKTVLLLDKVEGGLEAGKPYIFRTKLNKINCVYGDLSVSVAGNYHGLIGSFQSQPLAGVQSAYILKNGKVYQAGEGATVGENKAYIDMSQVPDASPSAKGDLEFGVEGGDPTGIENLTPAISERNGVVRNLQGVRVSENYKGVVISNGKKYLTK